MFLSDLSIFSNADNQFSSSVSYSPTNPATGQDTPIKPTAFDDTGTFIYNPPHPISIKTRNGMASDKLFFQRKCILCMYFENKFMG